ncbi:hypothetical protein [Edaphobacter sp.]|uniref:hypothetical protein n=1 Tax=Edaphobacter sp. TaxID=1934404 RepID=UPI002DB5B170|nr:hypothetical protein [Edaphobacter sp.]HEU5339811.1 hypothetical protein [Edaphobacter sp.]
MEDRSSAEETVLLSGEKSMGLEGDIFVEIGSVYVEIRQEWFRCSMPVACGLFDGLSEGAGKVYPAVCADRPGAKEGAEKVIGEEKGVPQRLKPR